MTPIAIPASASASRVMATAMAHRASRPAVRNVRRHKGQVLIWFLAFGATLAVVFAGVYSVGQVTSEKQKVVNATDAAAYSGALTEARALNLVSYTNRAVIANEVLVAQMVSLDSWTSYFAKATEVYQKEVDALATLVTAVPVLNVVVKALALSLKITNQLAKPLASGVDQATPTVIFAWERAFDLWYKATIVPAFLPPLMAQAANSAAQNVLSQNVARQDGRQDTAPRMVQVLAFGAKNQLEWGHMTKHYTKNGGGPNDNRRYAEQLLLASRDEFSTNRPGSDVFLLKALFGNSSVCAPFIVKFGSEKLGPTRLENYERWEAQDTVEFRIKPGPGGLTGCSWGKRTPLGVPQGWGRATADTNGTKGTIMNTAGGAGSLAYSANHGNRGYSGVKELYDVERGTDGKPTDEEITFSVAAAKPATAIRSNETLGFTNRAMAGPTGSPDLKAGFAGDQIAALSEAKVYFERPVRNARDITAGSLFRNDGNKEYASLYNPYWQVRLATPSPESRILAYGGAGINPALAVFAP